MGTEVPSATVGVMVNAFWKEKVNVWDGEDEEMAALKVT